MFDKFEECADIVIAAFCAIVGALVSAALAAFFMAAWPLYFLICTVASLFDKKEEPDYDSTH